MERHQNQMKMGWGRFAAMIGTSTIVMFFMMYQLVYRADHAFFSFNRFLSSLIMGGVMTAIMLVFMWRMYKPRPAKIAVLAAGLIVAIALLVINRGQMLIDDSRFMRAMIPHHSIAINNARKAEISDPRVRRLADQIIESQVKEIAEMKLLLRDIEQNGEQGARPLPPRSAQVTSEILPEIREALR